MTRKRPVQYVATLIVCFFCASVLFMGQKSINQLETHKANLKAHIETEWRQQAKRTLTNLVSQFNYDLDHGVVNPSDRLSIQQWAQRNLGGVLNGGPTGDGFMIDLSNEQFLWDNSPDCAKPQFITNGRYMKDEASMHHDKDQALFILDKMRDAQSTIPFNYNYWWNFDGSPEYLEWDIIPPGILGFNDESRNIGGIVNSKYSKILICLGTQEDEVQSTFSQDFIDIDNNIRLTTIVIGITLVLCMLSLITYIYLNKKLDKLS